MGSDFNILCYPYSNSFNCITLRGKNETHKKAKEVTKRFANGNFKKPEKR